MKGRNQKSKVLGWGETGDTVRKFIALHSGYLPKPLPTYSQAATAGPPPAHTPQSVRGWQAPLRAILTACTPRGTPHRTRHNSAMGATGAWLKEGGTGPFPAISVGRSPRGVWAALSVPWPPQGSTRPGMTKCISQPPAANLTQEATRPDRGGEWAAPHKPQNQQPSGPRISLKDSTLWKTGLKELAHFL